MLELFHKGGEMMYPILGCSVFALAVIVERLIVLAATPIPRAKVVAELLGAVRSGDTDRAISLASQGKTPVHRVLLAIAEAPGGQAAQEKAAGLAGDEVLRQLNQRLPWLAILGSLVPLMGLLGTVVGMIRVFSNVAAAGDVSDITLLAGGIWEALLTTAFGLAVAIPILLAYHLLLGKVDRVAFAMRRAGERYLLAQHACEETEEAA
jgi:biopolymer transport protein ExbB